LLDDGRRPAIRLRAHESMGAAASMIEFTDLVAGPSSGGVDDVVLQRNDGVPAYNLAVVLDDALQGVTQVVRGDDLLSSTPRQIHLQRLLGLTTPTYGHVPLVMGDDGERLSKRHGSVTLAELGDAGASTALVVAELLRSFGCETDASSDVSSLLSGVASSFVIGAITPGEAVYSPDPDAPAAFTLRNAR
jgi:glutamyl-tRNA synthetase